MKRCILAVVALLMLSLPAFGTLRRGFVRVSKRRPTLYEVRHGTTQSRTPTTVHVQGLWDHDGNPFTPEMPIEGVFDVDTGEVITWSWL